MSNPHDFPSDTILGNIRLDITASQSNGDVNIFHEGSFEDPLIGFEYYINGRELMFIFEGDLAMSLGAPVELGLSNILVEADKIGVFQVTDDGKAGKAEILPLKVFED